MSIKHFFVSDLLREGVSISAGKRDYQWCRAHGWNRYTSLSSAWGAAHWTVSEVKADKRDERIADLRRRLTLAKWWVKYHNPVADKVFDLWSALADRGYVKHFDHTCPDNDICQGHNAVHSVDKNGASNE